jgi:threonine/homoserine/homoserine lactone efflux protein
MFGIADYGAFCAAIVVFLAIPGPGNFALLTSTAKGGLWGGVGASLGVILGDQVLLWAAVAGVAAVLASHPQWFMGVQWLGAAYLGYLGVRLLLAREGSAPAIRIEPRHYLRQALFITLLNPKAIVFYMAFFPMFIDPQRHQGWVTFAAMALTIASITALYCILLISLARLISTRVSTHKQIGRWLEKGAGACMIGFGLKLGLS